MFGFLKKKLKEAVGKFTKDVDKESEKKEVVVKKKVNKTPKKKEVKKKEAKKPKKAPKKKLKKEEKKEKEVVGEIVEEQPEEVQDAISEELVEEKEEDVVEDDEEKIETEPIFEKEPEPESAEEEEEEEEETPEKEEEVEKKPEEQPQEKKGFFAKLKEKFIKPDKPEEEADDEEELEEEKETDKEESEQEEAEEEVKKETPEEIVEQEGDSEEEAEGKTEEIEEKPEEQPQEKKGFFAKLKETITTTKLSEQKFNDLFWELEVVLLENNVAVEVIEKIKEDLKKVLVNQSIPRGKLEEQVITTLRSSVGELFDLPQIDILKKIKDKLDKPYIIAFVGINGSGKTTTIAKVCHLLKKQGKKPVLAAADTFRAAAIQQLEEHGKKLDVKVIKHDYGSDPAAVAFDAIKYAQSKGNDVVLIDTAGRMHSNTNLIDEMKKIVRVAKPDLKIFVGESITGNDCTEQAKSFNDAITFDAIILTKADVDDKGGAALSISYITKKPILFFGVGQTYDDLEPFNKEKVIENIGL